MGQAGRLRRGAGHGSRRPRKVGQGNGALSRGEWSVSFFRRKTPAQVTIDKFAKGFVPSTATSIHSPVATAAMDRFIEAQAEREAQAKTAEELAVLFYVTDGTAAERLAEAMAIAEAYELAGSMTMAEIELSKAEKLIRIPDPKERQIDIQAALDGYEMSDLPGRFVSAAKRWRDTAEVQRRVLKGQQARKMSDGQT
jgi:hypothetical protein